MLHVHVHDCVCHNYKLMLNNYKKSHKSHNIHMKVTQYSRYSHNIHMKVTQYSHDIHMKVTQYSHESHSQTKLTKLQLHLFAAKYY